MTRRSLLLLLGSAAAGSVKWPDRFRKQVIGYLEQHRRPEGAYGWSSDAVAQLTPTFGVVG